MDAWKVWYVDGTTFSSADGAWTDAPSVGVLVVCFWRPNGLRDVWYGSLLYWDSGQASTLPPNVDAARIKTGDDAPDDQFLAIARAAIADTVKP